MPSDRVVTLAGGRVYDPKSATFQNLEDRPIHARDLRHLFLFIGADPNTDWLDGCVDADRKGIVLTGARARPHGTSQGGVLAIGEVRAGSTKRVAAAVGEGAAVVAQIHTMMAERSARESA